jgi:hypothetical protein
MSACLLLSVFTRYRTSRFWRVACLGCRCNSRSYTHTFSYLSTIGHTHTMQFDHLLNLQSGLAQLRTSDLFTDVRLLTAIAGPTASTQSTTFNQTACVLKAHKVVLAGASAHLRRYVIRERGSCLLWMFHLSVEITVITVVITLSLCSVIYFENLDAALGYWHFVISSPYLTLTSPDENTILISSLSWLV